MSRPERVGKRVTFSFSTHPNITGVVLSVPADTGDCWYIKCDDGVVFGIQQFDWVRITEND